MLWAVVLPNEIAGNGVLSFKLIQEHGARKADFQSSHSIDELAAPDLGAEMHGPVVLVRRHTRFLGGSRLLSLKRGVCTQKNEQCDRSKESRNHHEE